MPVKPFAIGIAILFLACAIWLVIGGVRRHRTRSLLRIPPILGCLAVVILLVPTIFGLGGPRSFFNKPAPVPASSLLFFNVAQSIVSRDTPTLLGSNPALLAVSAQTGKTLWQHSMQGQTFQTNDGRTVYTATSFRITYSSGSYIDTTYVAAFRATNGAILWQFWLYGTDITSPPVLANGILCLRVGHGGIDSSDSYGSPYYLQLLAVRALDGQQLWSISIFPHQGSSPNGLMSASAASNVLFVQPDSSTVQARRLTDGKLLWSRTVGDGTAGSIVAGPNGVYHYTYYGGADGGVVIALDARTGDELWRFGSHDFDIRTIRAVAVSSDTLYVTADYFTGHGGPAETGVVYALDAQTGALRWTFDEHTTQGITIRQLLVGPSTVYVQAEDGIHAVRRTDGAELWHTAPYKGWTLVEVPSSLLGSVVYVTALEPVPSDTINFTFFGPSRGQTFLYALDVASGSPYWKQAIGPVITVYPHITL